MRNRIVTFIRHEKGWIFLKHRSIGFRRLCLGLCAVMLLLALVPVAAFSYPTIVPPDNTADTAPNVNITPVSKVRMAPAPGYVIIGCLENGTALTVLGDAGNYYQIDCFDMTGYILKEQVMQDDSGSYTVCCRPDSTETTYLPVHNADDTLSKTSLIRGMALACLGIRYVKGGSNTRGFDCSGLTQYIFEKADYNLKRTVAQQLQSGIIIPKDELQCGDLVFFKYTTATMSLYSHVGIYIGNGQVLHASSTRGVTVNDLNSPYYTEHYLCARRVVLSEVGDIHILPSVNATQNMNSTYWRKNSQTETSGNSDSPAEKYKFPLYKMKKDCYNSLAVKQTRRWLNG